MQFGNPSSLAWLLLALPIVAAYLIKVRPRQLHVSTLLIWDRVFEASATFSTWRKVREAYSLLLQLLFLGLLTLALMDPALTWRGVGSRRIVLIVDNSASMTATDTEQGDRLGAARRHGLKLVSGLRHHDEMAIVTCGGEPRVVAGLAGQERFLAERLNSIEPTHGPTRLAQAIVLARRLLQGHWAGEIVLLSDACGPGVAELLAADDVRIIPLGGRSANAGITQFQARRSFVDPMGYEVLIEVSNHSASQVDCRLELQLGGELVDVIPLAIRAEGQWRDVLKYATAAGGELVASLDFEDSLQCDNRAVAILPGRAPQPVVLAGERNFFIEKALSSIPFVELRTEPTVQEAGSDVIFLYHGEVPVEIPRGNSMFIAPRASTSFWTIGEPIADPVVTQQDAEQPLMRHVQLENVVVPNARRMTFLVDFESLASALDESPIFAAIRTDQGQRILVLNADPTASDLPLRTAFPIMMSNAMAWFQRDLGKLNESQSTASVFRLPSVPQRHSPVAKPTNDNDGNHADGWSWHLVRPDGRRQALAPTADALIGPLDQCGVWRVMRQAETGRAVEVDRIACNLVDSQESDIRASLPPSVDQHHQLAAAGGRPAWFNLVLAALVLTFVEWILYQRRWVS